MVVARVVQGDGAKDKRRIAAAFDAPADEAAEEGAAARANKGGHTSVVHGKRVPSGRIRLKVVRLTHPYQ